MSSASAAAAAPAASFPSTSEHVDSRYAVHHCGQYSQLQAAAVDAAGFQELIIAQSQVIVRSRMGGDYAAPHELQGVQLVALAIADYLIDQGAARIAYDMGVDLDQLKRHAASESISAC